MAEIRHILLTFTCLLLITYGYLALILALNWIFMENPWYSKDLQEIEIYD